MAALDPVRATLLGVAGHDQEMTDYSPSGSEARHAHNRATLGELSRQQPASDRDRRAAEVIRERLQVAVDQYESGEHLRELRIIGSPFGQIRQVFDLMPRDSVDDWDIMAERMARVPEALAGFEAALREGAGKGLVAARRQALACAEQGSAWSGERKARPF
ncbi:MAG TPA: DUF885 family protein, partial [Candidatus Acidoferrum sp.]|nr:DUF885 family protein [Candidatus Acidoferrum sp.]